VSSLPTVRVAAVQATPVVLDATATIDKAVRLLRGAADNGARLVVFPETFVALYPSYVWAHAASGSALDELWGRLWEASVDVPGPLTDRLVDTPTASSPGTAS
jgi:nitrilase